MANRGYPGYSKIEMKKLGLLFMFPLGLALCGCALSPGRSAAAGVLDLRSTEGAVPLAGEWNSAVRDRIVSADVPLRSLLPAPPAGNEIGRAHV